MIYITIKEAVEKAGGNLPFRNKASLLFNTRLNVIKTRF
jgi:hypothetical protein